MGSGTLPLVGARLRFQALFNKVVGVGHAKNCKSCGCQVGFQILLQTASIVFLAFEHPLPENSNAK